MPGVSTLHHLLWTARLPVLQSYVAFSTMAGPEIQQMEYFAMKRVD